MAHARGQGWLKTFGLLAFLLFSLGCNWVTGADGMSVGAAEQDGPQDNPPPPDHGQGAAAAGGSTGSGATGGSTGSTTETSPPDPPVGEMEGAVGVTVNEIILYQGVSRPLMKNGQAVSSNTPVVANRDALLRVLYKTDGGYDGQQVSAELSIDGADPITQLVTLGGGSTEGNLQSTINFDVPGAMLTVGASFRVDLLQPGNGSGGNPSASFPSAPGALSAFGAKTSGVLNIKLVPIQYNGDGSGRLPDTSAGQLQAYEKLFYAMYPVEDVVVSVRSNPMVWSSAVSPFGNGWSSLLNAVADLRSQDGAAFDTYYYGIFAPASSIGGYCSGGCVAGLGFLGSPGQTYTRAAIGLGFSGSSALDTAVHELGHNHGRDHAPCGTQGEPSYPYSGASIGVYGYHLLTKKLYSPSKYVDMMSYCNPTWISDYTFTHLFNHTTMVSGADIYVPPHLQDATYQRLLVNPDGTVSPLSPIKLERPVLGQKATVTVKTLAGAKKLEAELLRYDHIDGGMLFLPPGAPPITAVTKISVGGELLPLSNGGLAGSNGLARPE